MRRAYVFLAGLFFTVCSISAGHAQDARDKVWAAFGDKTIIFVQNFTGTAIKTRVCVVIVSGAAKGAIITYNVPDGDTTKEFDFQVSVGGCVERPLPDGASLKMSCVNADFGTCPAGASNVAIGLYERLSPPYK